MKKLILFLALFIPYIMNAQELVAFKLAASGEFVADNDASYVIVPFEGKSAHEIYQIISANIGSLYNDPSKVMSGVEDSFIKVRAIIPISKTTEKIFMVGNALFEVDGHVQFEIKIKDGRVRVAAPLIEDYIWLDGGSSGQFSKLVAQWFKYEKKEKNRLENERKINELEIRVNLELNSILGSLQSPDDDDW